MALHQNAISVLVTGKHSPDSLLLRLLHSPG